MKKGEKGKIGLEEKEKKDEKNKKVKKFLRQHEKGEVHRVWRKGGGNKAINNMSPYEKFM